MSAITLVFAVLSAISTFVIAAVVIGREAHRLDAVAPRVDVSRKTIVRAKEK